MFCQMYLAIFFTCSSWHIHVIGVYVIYLIFHLYMYSTFRKISHLFICTCIVFWRGKILYIKGINFRVMHTCSSQLCTPHEEATYLVLQSCWHLAQVWTRLQIRDYLDQEGVYQCGQGFPTRVGSKVVLEVGFFKWHL